MQNRKQETFWLSFGCLICLIFSSIGCAQQTENTTQRDEVDRSSRQKQNQESQNEIRSLFDGMTLGGWEETSFGGEDLVKVTDGTIQLEMGYPLSGINWEDPDSLPRSNYEVTLEAKRIEGIDFFCGLTFPVKDQHCTLIVAGWAGATVGLSCIDDDDASSNDTTCYMDFKNDQWYKIKVCVTDEFITCWIDDEKVINQETTGHKVSVRGDVVASKPLGLCAFESKVAYRKISLRVLAQNKDEAELDRDKSKTIDSESSDNDSGK